MTITLKQLRDLEKIEYRLVGTCHWPVLMVSKFNGGIILHMQLNIAELFEEYKVESWGPNLHDVPYGGWLSGGMEDALKVKSTKHAISLSRFLEITKDYADDTPIYEARGINKSKAFIRPLDKIITVDKSVVHVVVEDHSKKYVPPEGTEVDCQPIFRRGFKKLIKKARKLAQSEDKIRELIDKVLNGKDSDYDYESDGDEIVTMINEKKVPGVVAIKAYLDSHPEGADRGGYVPYIDFKGGYTAYDPGDGEWRI